MLSNGTGETARLWHSLCQPIHLVWPHEGQQTRLSSCNATRRGKAIQLLDQTCQKAIHKSYSSPAKARCQGPCIFWDILRVVINAKLHIHVCIHFDLFQPVECKDLISRVIRSKLALPPHKAKSKLRSNLAALWSGFVEASNERLLPPSEVYVSRALSHKIAGHFWWEVDDLDRQKQHMSDSWQSWASNTILTRSRMVFLVPWWMSHWWMM